MRGSPTAAESMGINLTKAKITVFALSAGVAGLGGALYGSLEGPISSTDFAYELSLAFVVVVITTGTFTVEGAVQAGMGFALFQFILDYPIFSRIQGIEFVLFAFGAFTYAKHPEGIVEYQKTRWMNRIAQSPAALGRAARPRTVSDPGPTPGVDPTEPDTEAARGRSPAWLIPAASSPRCSRPSRSRSASAASPRSTTSPSRSRQARSSDSSARTAPARRRLFNCLNGQLRPEQGNIWFCGQLLNRMPAVPQGPARDREDLPAGRGLPGTDRLRALPRRRACEEG